MSLRPRQQPEHLKINDFVKLQIPHAEMSEAQMIAELERRGYTVRRAAGA